MEIGPDEKTRKELATVIKMSGLTDEQVKDKTKVDSFELVLENITSLRCFEDFSGLLELAVVRCKVERIEALERLTNLRKLWLSDNKISKIEGLVYNVKLEKLVLFNNAISRIENLESLAALRELDLSQNKIEIIENLNNVEQLEKLNLAMNSIERVGGRINSLTNLVELNLSGNKISNVEEVKQLKELGNLKALYFRDPHYGENPICKIYNYQTYILFHLDFLDKLDHQALSEESKKSAVIEFKKKKIYYNMRTKTLCRMFATLDKMLRSTKDRKRDLVLGEIKLLHSFVRLTGEQLEDLAASAERDLRSRVEEEKYLSRVYEEFRTYIFKELRQHIDFISIELESTGNFKLEEGSNIDRWFQTCINLVESRFDADQMRDYSIEKINVHRVLRIHNKFLRNRFDERVESFLDMSKPSYRKNFEYLFLGIDPDRPDDFCHVLERGFRPPAENESLGQGSYPLLFNTINGADSARISSFLKSQKKNHYPSSLPHVSDRISTATILVCKVVMIKPKPDEKQPHFSLAANLKAHTKDLSGVNTAPQDKEINATFREAEPKRGRFEHKLFFIHDYTLIIPEYLVYLDYETKNSDQKVAHIGDTLVTLSSKDQSFVKLGEDKQPDTKVDFLFKSKIDELKSRYTDGKYRSSEYQSIQFFNLDEFYRSGIDHLKVPILNYFIFFENASVSLQYYRSKANVLEQYKKDRASKLQPRPADFETQEQLVLHCLALDSLKISSPCPKLLRLDISCNQIKSVDFTLHTPNLEELVMVDNQLELIAPCICELKSLKLLDISFNLIKDINQLKQLKECKALKKLSVKGNLMTFRFPKYLDILTNVLPTLEEMDGTSLVLLRSSNSSRPVATLNSDMLHPAKSVGLDEDPSTFNLSHHNISAILLTKNIAEVRYLNISHNRLSKLDGLQFLPKLVHLNAESNSLVDITDVGHLIHLKVLELGSNLISNLGHALTGLKELTLLSMENNKIRSLSSFSELNNLLELYLGENLVDDLKEIRALGTLKKLVVLDLLGNPMCRDAEFRLFCIYNIKEIKVLDGINVSAKEQEDSKQAFMGKLSDELLAERLRGRNLDTLVSMDLSNCNLRDFDNIFNSQKFPKIVEMNLSGNFFTNLKCFGHLPTLKELNLADNRLASFEPHADPKVKIGLYGLPNLESLDISRNKFVTLDTLKFFNLQRLTFLKAMKNLIRKISCISHLTNLRDLDLSSNRIKTIDSYSFDPSMRLEFLCLDENFIKNFNNLFCLQKLRHLYIRYNKVGDYPEIEGLANIPYLLELDMSNNPLSRKYGYRFLLLQKLPNLTTLDGLPLTIEEKEKLDIILQREQQAKQAPSKPTGNQPAPARQVKMNSINFEEIMPNQIYRK